MGGGTETGTAAGAVQAAIAGEMRLLEPAVRASEELLRELLHPGFIEFGSSGRKWDRTTIVGALRRELDRSGAAPASVSRMAGVELAPGLVHLTYMSDNNGRRAYRSSLWRLTGQGWRLYFHQATPTAEGGGDGEQGGESACQLHRVCAECGRMNEYAGVGVCEACGASLAEV
jgi:hypothetical protein